MKNFDRQPRQEGDIVQDNTIITEKFDPVSELEQIKHLPKKERRQAIEDYKEKLLSQKEDIAGLEETLGKAFRESPDGKEEYFLSLLENEASRLNISETQYSIFRDTIHDMTERRKTIKNIHKEFPDNQKLFKELFGFIPSGDINITLGPLNFRIKISNINDFAKISEGAFLSGKKVTKEHIEEAQYTGGRTLSSCFIDGLDHAIVIMNESEETKELMEEIGVYLSHKDMVNHEEQHVVNAFLTERKIEKYFKREIATSVDDDAIELFLLAIRKYEAEWNFKNEVLAFLKGGAAPEHIQEMLMDEKGEYSSNYYAPMAKKLIRKTFGEEYKKRKTSIDELVKKIMRTDLIKIEQNAMKALVKLTQSGMPRQKIIYFLQSEPLSKWPNFARRYLEKNRQ